jgi:membrane protease YdiL (CAAX protease family)
MGKAIGFIIVGVLLSFIPLLIVIYLVFGSEPDESDPTYLTVSIASSVVLQLLMLGAVVRFGVGKHHAPPSALGLRKPGRGGYWLPIPLVISAYALMIVYFSLLSAFDISPDADLPEGTFENIGPIIAVAVLSLVFAPFCEEVFFRGYIFAGLRNRWGGLWAALASGLLFGVVHAANPGAFYIVPPIAAIGALFAWAYIYSGSITASIGAHFLFNLTSFAFGILEA